MLVYVQAEDHADRQAAEDRGAGGCPEGGTEYGQDGGQAGGQAMGQRADNCGRQADNGPSEQGEQDEGGNDAPAPAAPCFFVIGLVLVIILSL